VEGISVPFNDLSRQTDIIRRDVLAEWSTILEEGLYIHGPRLELLESELSQFLGVDHAIGVGNGGDALEIALRACEVAPGDEVILPANSYAATAMAVLNVGATPILVDVDRKTHLIKIDAIANACSAKTAAVIPVHLYGQMVNMTELHKLGKNANIEIIEDAAQCIGANQREAGIGELSNAACISFYPGKNLGAFGDAGAVVTNDADCAHRMREIRNYGGTVRYEHRTLGRNSRLDELQAAVLRAKLPYLKEWTGERNKIATRYSDSFEALDWLDLPVTADGNDHVWHLYVVKCSERDQFQNHLANQGVQTVIHYPHTLETIPGVELRHPINVAQQLAEDILSLPMFPGLTTVEQQHVIHAVRTFEPSRGS